jgi:transketolase
MDRIAENDVATEVRKLILELAYNSKEGHVPSSFSVVEILISILEVQLSLSKKHEFQRIILSKGHATYAWYALLKYHRLLTEEEFRSVGSIGSKFYGHLPFVHDDPRFSYGTGSLGHGLPFALGKALGSALIGDMKPHFVIVGDGEANEGTFWESLLLINKFQTYSRLNLKIMIDSNLSSERAIPIESNLKRLKTFFNILYIDVNGHDQSAITSAILESGNEICIINCSTVKGYPIQELSDPSWHHKLVDNSNYHQITARLHSSYSNK